MSKSRNLNLLAKGVVNKGTCVHIVLSILTSKRVLCMPVTGGTHLLGILSTKYIATSGQNYSTSIFGRMVKFGRSVWLYGQLNLAVRIRPYGIDSFLRCAPNLYEIYQGKA